MFDMRFYKYFLLLVYLLHFAYASTSNGNYVNLTKNDKMFLLKQLPKNHQLSFPMQKILLQSRVDMPVLFGQTRCKFMNYPPAPIPASLPLDQSAQYYDMRVPFLAPVPAQNIQKPAVVLLNPGIAVPPRDLQMYAGSGWPAGLTEGSESENINSYKLGTLTQWPLKASNNMPNLYYGAPYTDATTIRQPDPFNLSAFLKFAANAAMQSQNSSQVLGVPTSTVATTVSNSKMMRVPATGDLPQTTTNMAEIPAPRTETNPIAKEAIMTQIDDIESQDLPSNMAQIDNDVDIPPLITEFADSNSHKNRALALFSPAVVLNLDDSLFRASRYLQPIYKSSCVTTRTACRSCNKRPSTPKKYTKYSTVSGIKVSKTTTENPIEIYQKLKNSLQIVQELQSAHSQTLHDQGQSGTTCTTCKTSNKKPSTPKTCTNNYSKVSGIKDSETTTENSIEINQKLEKILQSIQQLQSVHPQLLVNESGTTFTTGKSITIRSFSKKPSSTTTKKCTNSKASGNKDSKSNTVSPCQKKLQNILHSVQELQPAQPRPVVNEGLPCSIYGRWSSPQTGTGIYVRKNGKDVKVKLFDDHSACGDGLGFMKGPDCPADSGWTFKASFPIKRASLFVLTASRNSDLTMATFTGECRACEGEELVVGHWLLMKAASTVDELNRAQDFVGDVWKRAKPANNCDTTTCETTCETP